MLIYINYLDRIEVEQKFFESDKIIFVPDITIYALNKVIAFVEIVHKSPLTQYKIEKIFNYCRNHKIKDVMLMEISADYILNQVQQPTYIKDLKPIVL
jgi:hypothetical protein